MEQLDQLASEERCLSDYVFFVFEYCGQVVFPVSLNMCY